MFTCSDDDVCVCVRVSSTYLKMAQVAISFLTVKNASAITIPSNNNSSSSISSGSQKVNRKEKKDKRENMLPSLGCVCVCNL